jgi:23S rRNA (cytidine1920-2'-O)/16S rRNA (cytidine1409-2'-O)-methyltransferase
VADLSFISLTKVIPVIVQTFGVHSHYIVLVKPQFEVGRGRISHGVVKDAQLRTKALVHVAAAFAASQVPVRDVIVSPIHGEKGNEEYLLYASATSSVHPAEWDQSLGE